MSATERPSRLLTWEENVERRLLLIEQKVDKLLDPETGVYAKLASIELRLGGWAIAVLTAIAISLAVQLVVHN